MNPEQIIDPAPDHFKELMAEVKYSDMPEQTKKKIKEIILEHETMKDKINELEDEIEGMYEKSLGDDA